MIAKNPMTTPRNGGECCFHLHVLLSGFCTNCGEMVDDSLLDEEAQRDFEADRCYDELRDEGLL